MVYISPSPERRQEYWDICIRVHCCIGLHGKGTSNWGPKKRAAEIVKLREQNEQKFSAKDGGVLGGGAPRCKWPIFWIPNIPFQFFEILLPDFSRKSMFQRARSSFTSRSGSPSVQPRHRGDWGKRHPRLNVLFISICSLSDHYHHISSLSPSYPTVLFSLCKTPSAESPGGKFWIGLSDYPKVTIQNCAALCSYAKLWSLGARQRMPSRGRRSAVWNGAKAMDNEVMKSL